MKEQLQDRINKLLAERQTLANEMKKAQEYIERANVRIVEINGAVNELDRLANPEKYEVKDSSTPVQS